MLTQVKSLGILLEMGVDSLNIIVIFVLFKEYYGAGVHVSELF